MTARYFSRWNWEYDYGEAELDCDPGDGVQHATALYDQSGRLYRVSVIEQIGADSDSPEEFVYDYFCDDDGGVREKRSLDGDGNVVLLVRYYYDTDEGSVRQDALSPSEEKTNSRIVSDYVRKRQSRH